MLFNSITFFVFIGIFLPVYFALKGKMRLLWCLMGSYFFYGFWDYRFLSLIIISTLIDYSVGLLLQGEEHSKKRKQLLVVSLIINLGFLGFFKYFNFFVDSFATMLISFGLSPSLHTLNIILPVGISFYTFQSMSYTIDVYFKKIPVETSFLRFATFIAFFPQLVAGPIVRAKEFLPQFRTDKPFDWNRFNSGSGQMLWGFFKKIVVADSLAPFVDICFETPAAFSSMQLLMGVFFYSFQIYCDFSGYSDIAIGLARIMGFDFPENFRTPYFSKNFSEFWQRWHITLSRWLRDYLYIPLGGNRAGSFGSYFFPLFFMGVAILVTGWWWLLLINGALIVYAWLYMRQSDAHKVIMFTYLNNMATMLLGGLWHGASYAFLFWGFLHGLYLIVQRLAGPYFGQIMRKMHLPKLGRDVINILLVYTFTCLAWIFFRATDFSIAIAIIEGILKLENFTFGSIVNKFWFINGLLVIALLLAVEIADFKLDFGSLVKKQPVFRAISFATVLMLIAFLGTFGSNAFIYFVF